MLERNQQARAVQKAQIHGENGRTARTRDGSSAPRRSSARFSSVCGSAAACVCLRTAAGCYCSGRGQSGRCRDDGVAAASGRCRSPDPRPRDVVGCADARDRTGHTNRSPGRLGHAMFRRLGRSPIYAQRGAVPFYDQNQLHPFSAHGLADCFAPFLACRNVASRKASSQSRCPRCSSWRSSCRHAFPNLQLLPTPQAPPAGHAAGIRHRQVAPACTRTQQPQNALHTGPIRRPRTATTIAPPPWRGEKSLDALPVARA